jgi:hypothetical protein
MRLRLRTLFLAAACALPPAVAVATAAPTPGDPAYFTQVVRPILAAKCFSCHAVRVHLSDFRLDSRAAALKGGKRGAALAPGEPEKSLLVRALHYDGPLKMPPA